MSVPTNQDRAQWAAEAVSRFRRVTNTEPEDALADLLCDLMHWADREGYDFYLHLTRAADHYGEELEEDEQEEQG